MRRIIAEFTCQTVGLLVVGADPIWFARIGYAAPVPWRLLRG